jgi:RNA polymerase sigma factor (sigma-70 family)
LSFLGFIRSILNFLTFSKADDETLVNEYLKSPKSLYFDLLYKRYKGKVYGKCLSMLDDIESSQDAVQEIFLKVLLNLATFKKDSRFSTWIYSITYNHCIDVIRKEGKLNVEAIDDRKHNDVLPDSSNIEEQKLLQIKVDRLDTVLNTIPVRDKSILLMKYQGELSIKEISDILGKSESAVKMTLKRAKEKSLKTYEEMFTD